MNLNEERLKSDIKDTGGFAYPQSHSANYPDEIVGGMTLRDAFAKDAPITISDVMAAWYAINPSSRNENKSPTYGEIYVLMADMRYEYADAMLAERVK